MQGYAAFANEGYKVEPHIISKVEDEHGNILYQADEVKENVLNKSITYVLNELLTNTYDKELIDYSYKTLLLIQCIKAIGKDNITEEEIIILRNKLNPIDKRRALEETPILQAWIRKIVVLICKE